MPNSREDIYDKLQEIVTELRYLVAAVKTEVEALKAQLREELNQIKDDIKSVEKYQDDNKHLPFQVSLLWGAMLAIVVALMGAILTEIGNSYIHKQQSPPPTQEKTNNPIVPTK